MKKLILAFLCLLLLGSNAGTQTSPGLSQGQVPTPGQWNSYFAAKQDFLGVPPLLQSGGALTGKLILNPSSSSTAGFNIGQGTVPSAPVNGDMWATIGGLFIRINGSTNGPFGLGLLSGNPGGVIYFSSPTTQASTATGTTGQALISAGSGAPTFQSMRQIIPLSNSSTTLAQNTTGFMISGGIITVTEAQVSAICPISGTFKNLYISSTPPASGQTLTATWRVALGSTALTCVITGPAATCNDTTHTAACTPGQLYDLQVVTSATSGSILAIAGGVEFDNP